MSSHVKLSDEKVIAFTPLGDIHGHLTEISSLQTVSIQQPRALWLIPAYLVQRIKAVGS